TAVDDQKAATPGEDAGAGMIGTVEFNSATLYRYATVGVDQLMRNLDGSRSDAADAITRFVDGFVRSMPTGKSNTFANRTLPSLVLVVMRSDQPINLVSAFEQPVRAGFDSGLMTESADRLIKELEAVDAQWASPAVLTLANYSGSLGASLGASAPFPSLLTAVREAIAEDGDE
ncbi:MAG TPA: type I-E CRISPR-associated protein Cas7/Cse4/CasC, partial [Ilumatobacteraceae bacterium]|nr:type I-E CRISPR-associated protein Cas7/Cse4/CasC [Ilumatobacteraceae bacterium]